MNFFPFIIRGLFTGILWPILLFRVAHGDEMVIYQWPDVPLEIDLAVNTEQRLSIPEATVLRMGIPPAIKPKLQVEIIGNHLWMKATDTFPATKLVVIARPGGRVILQIRAQRSKSFNQPIVIQSTAPGVLQDSSEHSATYGFVKLTRWVVQQFYAPKRLLTPLSGVQRLSIEPQPVELFRCAMRLPTVCAGAITATPIASWQSPHHFITAIELINNRTQQLVLDPRELRGNWRSAAFVHTQLHAKGHAGDTTVLVLISDHPFIPPHF